MGYCCDGFGDIKFKDVNGALTALNSYIKNEEYLNSAELFLEEYDNLEDAFREACRRNGSIEVLDSKDKTLYSFYYDGKWHPENLNDVFNLIAPFVESGDLEFVGEDGEHWKYVFKNGVFYEYSGNIVYEDEGMLNQQAKDDLKQLWEANAGDENTRSIIMSVLECVGCSEEFKSLLDEEE